MNFQLFFILIGALTVNAEVEDGISYLVAAGKRDCFYRDLKRGDKMDFDLQVISGADVDITISILSPTGQELLFEYQQTEVSREIPIEEDGPVEICLDNTFSRFSNKVVYFDLGIEEHDRDNEVDDIAGLLIDEIENRSEILNTLDGIAAKFDTIEQMQAIVRSRYLRHEYLQGRNQWRVTYFSGFSCFIMVWVGVIQVMLIRHLFDNKKVKGLQSST